jgi:hypothetical protein
MQPTGSIGSQAKDTIIKTNKTAMRKKLFALLLLPSLAFATTIDWITVRLDDRVSVAFPAKPEEKEMSGNAVWVADSGPNARCMAMVLDFEKFGMDSATLAGEMGKDESFAQFKEGILGQIEGATLISEKKTTTSGKMTFEYVIDMGKKDTAALNKMYNKNIFIGNKMYSFSFYEKDHLPQTAAREKFFNSFKLNY